MRHAEPRCKISDRVTLLHGPIHLAGNFVGVLRHEDERADVAVREGIVAKLQLLGGLDFGLDFVPPAWMSDLNGFPRNFAHGRADVSRMNLHNFGGVLRFHDGSRDDGVTARVVVEDRACGHFGKIGEHLTGYF